MYLKPVAATTNSLHLRDYLQSTAGITLPAAACCCLQGCDTIYVKPDKAVIITLVYCILQPYGWIAKNKNKIQYKIKGYIHESSSMR